MSDCTFDAASRIEMAIKEAVPDFEGLVLV
jgi:hypothetical protein